MVSLAPPRPPDSRSADSRSADSRSTGARSTGPPAPDAPLRRRLRPPGLDALFSAVFALFGWGVGIERLSDNSFFWHLRTGELILDRGIPHTDVFSYTAGGTRWIAQSWLAELLYGTLDRIAGPFGIRVFGGLVGAAIGVLVFRLALRLARDRTRASLLSVAALAGLYTVWSERPLLLGVLFFVVMLWIVEVPDSILGRRPVVSLAVVFWLWANVHGTFALGFVYLGLHLAGRWLDGARPWNDRERRLTIAGVVAFAATFVNPYGASLVAFPVELMRRGDVLRDVVEWSSPDFHGVRGYGFALWLVVFTVVVARAGNRVSRRDLVVSIPFLLLGLWALRNIAIAPLVCLPVAARAVAVPRRTEGPRLRLGWIAVAALLVVGIALTGRAASRPDFAFDSYPVEAMRSVERQGLLGRHLLADDADGGYVILRYWPRQQVFFDDRFDMYPRSLIRDFETVSTAEPGWDRVLERHDVEVVVWERRRSLSQLLREDRTWRITHRDADYLVFVRDGVTGSPNSGS